MCRLFLEAIVATITYTTTVWANVLLLARELKRATIVSSIHAAWGKIHAWTSYTTYFVLVRCYCIHRRPEFEVQQP
ncbi:hypothetical protein BDB00DRAFT_815322 [Zychaea mexicana]|uniref:uncharacterized protein n=1 Tax=Zychaea mexicana TaxID=64656 RepID=UPI0022FDC543|nr:uncharacterized protein BDB00DRAFT_815322 [Zychaea mexicana]KAI9495256.1 hypothetical protein BDB00DRAFT_815322 [Zychaea mexicana]